MSSTQSPLLIVVFAVAVVAAVILTAVAVAATAVPTVHHLILPVLVWHTGPVAR